MVPAEALSCVESTIRQLRERGDETLGLLTRVQPMLNLAPRWALLCTLSFEFCFNYLQRPVRMQVGCTKSRDTHSPTGASHACNLAPAEPLQVRLDSLHVFQAIHARTCSAVWSIGLNLRIEKAWALPVQRVTSSSAFMLSMCGDMRKLLDELSSCKSLQRGAIREIFTESIQCAPQKHCGGGTSNEKKSSMPQT